MMLRKISKFLFILIFLCYFNLSSFAGGITGDNTKLFGARSIGLSNSFTAMDNDVNAIYYNPAGIYNIKTNVFSTSYSNPYKNILDNYKQYNLIYAIPLNFGVNVVSYSVNSLTFDYSSIADFDPLSWKESTLKYSLGFKFKEKYALGFNLSYNKVTSSINSANADGLSFDIGFLSNIDKDLILGISLKNIYDELRWDNGTNESADLKYAVGLKYNILDKWNILGDLKGSEGENFETVSFGTEYTIFESIDAKYNGGNKYFNDGNNNIYPKDLSVIFRGGIEKDLYDAKDFRYSLGVSFGVGVTTIDYAFKYDKNGPTDDLQHYFTLDFNWGNENKENDVNASLDSNDLPPLPDNLNSAPVQQVIHGSKKAEIAIITFKDLNTSKSNAWLGSGISDMLIKNLQQYKKISVKDRKEVSQMVSLVQPNITTINPEIAAQIGILVNADIILIGTYKITNEKQITIHYKLFNTDTREKVLDKKVNGTLSQLFKLIQKINSDVDATLRSLNLYYLSYNK